MRTSKQRRRRLTSWGIPLAYVVVTLIVGIIFMRVENRLFPHLVSSISAPSAMAVCSSIASGMIALTGIVFSLAFVMVQFSATAYSPRLVLWVARDPVVSHALGVFTAMQAFSKDQEQNLKALSALLNEKEPNQRILKAELGRELGEFDECLRLLSQPFDERYGYAVGFIKKLAEENVRVVRSISPAK